MSTPDRGELIVYRTEDGQAEVQLQALDGTVWLNQGEMAELFDTTKQNVSLHIKNILKEGELPEASVVKEYLTTAEDWQLPGAATVKESLTVQNGGGHRADAEEIAELERIEKQLEHKRKSDEPGSYS